MTSTNHNNARKLIQIIGQVDVFEDSTASDTTISVFTPEGEEYVVVARKVVRRLLRFAGEEIDIDFVGYVDHDSSSGLDILSVVSFKPTREDENMTAASASDYGRDTSHKKRKKTIAPDLDDEAVNAEDFDQAEGFDTIIIHADDLTALPLDDDDEDMPLDAEDLDLDLDDLDLTVLNALVKEALEKNAPATAEPVPDHKPASDPTATPDVAARQVPLQYPAPNQTAPPPDARPDKDRRTEKTVKKTAGRLDKAPTTTVKTAATRTQKRSASPVTKTVRAVDPKTPAKPDIPKNKKTEPPNSTSMKKSPQPPPKAAPSQAPKKTPAKPPTKKIPGQTLKAARQQDANTTATTKNQLRASKKKASITVATARKTAEKPSGTARSRKRPS